MQSCRKCFAMLIRILAFDFMTLSLPGRGFARGVIQGIVTEHDIDEASGCAASRTHPGILYTLNDHGGENRVFALATNGTLLAKYTIDGAKNVDWEDIAVGPCSNSNNAPDCIYIGKTSHTCNRWRTS